MEDLVINLNQKAVTTSLKVAEVYGKTHKNVLRAINNLMGSAQTCAHLFEKSFYFDRQGKERPMFYMNRDGYTLLVMGFEGKDALQFKLKYMEAFNKMETYLTTQTQIAKPTSSLDIIQAMLDSMRAQETRLLSVEQRLNDIDNERVEATQNLLVNQYLSNEKGKEISLRDKCRKLVNEYSAASGIKQQDVWHSIYNELYYEYKISINSYKKLPGEKSMLDVVERIGAMQKVHVIISNMVYNLNK